MAASTYWKFPFKKRFKQVIYTSLTHFMLSLALNFHREKTDSQASYENYAQLYSICYTTKLRKSPLKIIFSTNYILLIRTTWR